MGVTGREAARTANPVHTTPVFGVKKGICGDAVDGGNPYMMAAGIGSILI
jgi:hypothetical protein